MRFKLPSLSADDIFISYSRKDANTYAVGLADELTRRGFSCFFDRLGTDADQNLPPSLIKKIRGCAMLVVVGSPAAGQSGFVAQEVEEFTRANGTSRAVPIYFGAVAGGAVWQQSLIGIAPEVEDARALGSGNPSPAVVNRIEKSFRYARSKDRLRRYTVGAALTLALLLLASFGAALFAREQLAQARQARAEADREKAAAEQARGEARAAQGDAREQKRLAEAAAGEARDAVRRAEEETTRAQAAETNAREAQQSAATAKAAAVEQQRLAELASAAARDERAKAEREALNAKAAGLVSVARGMANADPLTASLLLTEIRSPSEPSEGVAAARELLNRYVTKITLRGHVKSPTDVAGIYAVAYSPDGKRVVTAGQDRTARVWATDLSGRSVVLRGHEREVLSAEFSPDGGRVVTASDDGTARVWQADGAGSPVVLRGEGLRLEGAQFSPDGRRVLAYGGNNAYVWSADGTGRPVVLSHPEHVGCAVFSPDGRVVATGSGDGLGRVWQADGAGEPVVLRGSEDTVIAADFSPDGKLLAMGSLRGGGRVWRADGTGEPVVLGNPRSQVQVVKFSPDGNWVAIMPFGESVEIWAADGTRRLSQLAPPGGQGGPAHTISFSKDGKLVLVSWHNGLAELWNADGTGTPVVLGGHKDSLSGAAFSPDERDIVTASYDATARIWTRSGRDDPVLLRGEPHSRARFSPDGRRIVAVARWGSRSRPSDAGEDDVGEILDPGVNAAAAAKNPVLVWNADGTGKTLVLRGHTNSVAEASFSPDSTKVLTASFDGTARLWSLDGKARPVVFGGHGGPVRRAGFSPDGTRIFTVTDQVTKGEHHYPTDGIARVWAADGKGAPVVLRGHKEAINSVSFSPDGRRLITAGKDGTVRVWPADGVGEPVVLRSHKYNALDAGFDPTGRRVVSVAADKTAVIQNADGTGRPLVWEAKDILKEVEFSPDGMRVAILGHEGSNIHIWSVGDGGKVYALRGHTRSVNSVRFSPDGKYLVTSSYDGTARLWLVDGRGEPLVLRSGEGGSVYWAEFSPDQTRVLIVASSDRPAVDTLTARVWTVSWKELVARLRERTAECLSVEQRLKYLGEAEAEAAARFAECERGFGRAPAPE